MKILILLSAFVALVVALDNETSTISVTNDLEVTETSTVIVNDEVKVSESTTSLASNNDEEVTINENENENVLNEDAEVAENVEINTENQAEKVINKTVKKALKVEEVEEPEEASITSIHDLPKYNRRHKYPFGKYTELNAPNESNYKKYAMFVHDQEKCRGSWAFAAISQAEIMQKYHFIKYDTALSPQYLLDCSDYSCKRGWPAQAFRWLKKSGLRGGNNKAPSIEDYPLSTKTNAKKTCQVLPDDKYVQLNISKVVELRNLKERKLTALVANYGAITVAIHVTRNFFAYKSGVFHDKECSSDCSKVNHAVVIVGYGTDRKTGKKYWLLKNSWGPFWGEDGYIRLERKGKSCGIGCFPTFIY